MKLEGWQEQLRPRSFLYAVHYFWGALRDLDAAISKDTRGTVEWVISSITKGSPAIISFGGQSRLAAQDYTARIEGEFVSGVDMLTTEGQRPEVFPDAVIKKVLKLSELQVGRRPDRLSLIKVYTDHNETTIGTETRDRVKSLMEAKYESLGSVVGNLDSVSVHFGHEFRVWDEITGRPITCRFPRELLGKVKDALGRRILVYGVVRANYRGDRTLVVAEGIESYPEEAKLPTIEEMSGFVDDLTGGMSLEEYMQEIRGG
ncbi:hypothetical protein ACFLST_00070 [Chloroflexota bacterium]